MSQTIVIDDDTFEKLKEIMAIQSKNRPQFPNMTYDDVIYNIAGHWLNWIKEP